MCLKTTNSIFVTYLKVSDYLTHKNETDSLRCLIDYKTIWVRWNQIKVHIKVFLVSNSNEILNYCHKCLCLCHICNHFRCSLESCIMLYSNRLRNAFCSVSLKGQSHALWTIHSVARSYEEQFHRKHFSEWEKYMLHLLWSISANNLMYNYQGQLV